MFDPNRESTLRQAIEDLYYGYRAFTEVPDRMLAELDLGRTHHRILYFVGRRPGLSVGELLTVLDVSKQAVHRPIKELEERGLIAIRSDDADRRVRRLTLTDAGADLESQLTTSQMRLLDDAFAELPTESLEQWHRVMRRLADRVDE
ncbi:MAG: MarR family transcriptional regulator [Gordonia sp. (in: high G+C Gram-positive bacteria)]